MVGDTQIYPTVSSFFEYLDGIEAHGEKTERGQFRVRVRSGHLGERQKQREFANMVIERARDGFIDSDDENLSDSDGDSDRDEKGVTDDQGMIHGFDPRSTWIIGSVDLELIVSPGGKEKRDKKKGNAEHGET